ncbi:hypothetical protein [Streptomyces sp. NRRL S-146]|uniref:hypothetical protein n=1 Tax=Streptomyces sp. NRRL S-146 TaxID=1463884 RepID=UPI00131E70B4|nr:hypothetical protein [Streptomyces sp. NRRL S-146]
MNILIRLTSPSTAPESSGQSESGGDGVETAVDAGGKGAETGQVVLPDGVEPDPQVLTSALRKHDHEGTDMPGEGAESGTVHSAAKPRVIRGDEPRAWTDIHAAIVDLLAGHLPATDRR